MYYVVLSVMLYDVQYYHAVLGQGCQTHGQEVGPEQLMAGRIIRFWNIYHEFKQYMIEILEIDI